MWKGHHGARGAILVTGCSSGIGRATALQLHARGYTVFAGLRRMDGAEELRRGASPRLIPLLLDVTDPDGITVARERVAAACGEDGLLAVVNNAGRNLGGPWEYTADAEIGRLLDVNLLGPHRVARAFLPLLRAHAAHGGRPNLVNVGSVGSLIGVPWEAFYHASKFGLLGWSESIAVELRGQGVRVSVVMPGGIRTPFIAKTTAEASAAEAALPPEAPEAYRRGLRRMGRMAGEVDRFGSAPERVAKRIAGLVAMREPPARVLVGPDARLLASLRRWLPGRGFERLMSAAFAP
jgi:NAD(P)-dependent dehydrogenase (short-subunit alcohol dehydrogenase family)